MNSGLTTDQFKLQLNKFGYNELPLTKSQNILRVAFEVVKEPMFLLLISCGILYFILGDYTEGIVLISWVFVIIFITFYQHQKTEKALESLRKLSSPRALAIRDGIEKRIPGREVVPEDVIILNEGDRIPADGVIFETLNLAIDESILTGESIPVNKEAQSENSKNNEVYSGTLVIKGIGRMLVKKTGVNTKFGQIGKSLENIQAESTNLQKETKRLIRTLLILGIFLSAGVIVAFYLTRGDIIQSLVNGIATAMAMLPEEFPVVLTVFLAIGAWRLSKNHVLTRKPSAIETLGSATVLCSDKTGTITQNKMEIVSIYCDGTIINKDEFVSKSQNINKIVCNAYRASQKDNYDPMDTAISVLYEKFGQTNMSESVLIKEYPLSKELFALTRVFKLGKTYIASCKGAPEAIFDLCKMKDSERTRYLEILEQLAKKGQRLLGVACAKLDAPILPTTQNEFDFNFMGLLCFEDPIRPEVPAAIEECYHAGIRTIMITGDYSSTALSIAKQAGIRTNGKVLTGNDLAQMDDATLIEKIRTTNVFARIIPDQKLRIIQALKKNGEIIAMTGDGVNDAPALKAADIGISMGLKGTDVAREASSMVLLDDNFASIVGAIKSGRRIFDNLRKAMSYIIAIHIPIIGLTLVPALLPSFPILLMPLHIVFMELIIDPICSIAFELESEEIDIMNRPPRNPKERFFGFRKIAASASIGVFLTAMVLVVYFLSIQEHHTDGEIRAITFSTLIFGNIFLIITTLSKTRNFISILKEKNLALFVIIGLALTALSLVILVPGFSKVFSFDFPGFQHFYMSILASFIMLFILELVKFFLKKKSIKNES